MALDVLISINAFATMIQVLKRFPLLSPVKYLFAPVKKLSSLAEMESNTRKSVLHRIERRGNMPRPDLFEHILSADEKPPTTEAELLRIGSVVFQVMLAGFGPMADWYYFTLFLLINAPDCYEILKDEIRNKFASYDDINVQSTAHLHYLVACLDETLRMVSKNSTGLPRYSPGAVVDGHYIPKGVSELVSLTTEFLCLDSRLPSRAASTPLVEVLGISMTPSTSGQNGTYHGRILSTTRHFPTTASRDCPGSVSAPAAALGESSGGRRRDSSCRRYYGNLMSSGRPGRRWIWRGWRGICSISAF